jgi:hypothetical protein
VGPPWWRPDNIEQPADKTERRAFARRSVHRPTAITYSHLAAVIFSELTENDGAPPPAAVFSVPVTST